LHLYTEVTDRSVYGSARRIWRRPISLQLSSHFVMSSADSPCGKTWAIFMPSSTPLHSTPPRPYPLVQTNSPPWFSSNPSFFEMAFLLCISLGWARSWLRHEMPQSVASSLMLGLHHRKYSCGR
jgi:hypothetical protein